MDNAQQLQLRRAGPSDLETLLPLVGAYRAFYGQECDTGKERGFVESHLRAGTSIIYLACSTEAHGDIAGFIQLFAAYSTVHLAPSWILEDLFVTPAARGRGVATALLERALMHARSSGACAMFLETAIENVTAQRVYERAGWAREGRFLKYNAPL